MNRVFLTLSIVALTMQFSLAQFGSLRKAFEKGLKLSEMSISDEDERKLGEAISERIRQAYGVQQDEDATRYVTLVGRVVAAKSSRPDLDYQFIILDSDSTNAFAAPGGLIHITRGALALIKSEAELAGVLAHEIAHITEKHTIKGLQKMKGIEFASNETSITSNSAIFEKLADQGAEALLSGFGRKEELTADEVGVHLAADCNYSEEGLIHFLESLQSRYISRNQKAGLFASHPQTEERLKKLKNKIKKARLARPEAVMLTERFESRIEYELAAFSGTGTVVEGARGMAGEGDRKQSDKEEGEEQEEEGEEKKSGGMLGKIKNPFGSGKKTQRAEVTGTAAARGVETELGIEEPGNPARVSIVVSAEELEKFKREGKLA